MMMMMLGMVGMVGRSRGRRQFGFGISSEHKSNDVLMMTSQKYEHVQTHCILPPLEGGVNESGSVYTQ